MKDHSELGRAFREDLSAHSAEVVTRLASVFRNAYVHSANNESWRPLLEAARRVLGRLVQVEQSVHLEFAHGQVVVNQQRVRPSFNEHGAYRYLVEETSKRFIGSIHFARTPDASELLALAYTLSEFEEADAAGLRAITARLLQRGVSAITLGELQLDLRFSSPGMRDRRGRALLLFLKGVGAMREVMDGLRAGRSVGFKRAKRFVQEAVEFLGENRGLALALTTLKNCGGYLENHAVNVCFYSLLLGEQLGFDKRRLGDLGLAALVRDLGKATLSAELLDKPTDLSPEEWTRFKRFPHVAVPGLLRFRGFHEGTLRQVLVSFEHQFQSAQDRTLTTREFNLFTRIAHISGEFDAMTSSRPYRPAALTPHDALRMVIRDRHRTGTDPMLLKAFVHAMGLFPVGSLVLLDTRELGIVADVPFDDASLARPRVRLIAAPDGGALPTAPLVELTAVDEHGRFRRSIVAAVDPLQHGINVPRLLLLGAATAGR